MEVNLKYFWAVLLILMSFNGVSSQVNWQGQPQLNLDKQMEFSVSDQEQLVSNAQWYSSTNLPPRTAEQYLHFRVSIVNQKNIDQSLWLIIPFPSIKHLTLSDGLDTWHTGDASIFSSRPVDSPDYIFPIQLKANQATRVQGVMHGEILRYSFLLSTPEAANTTYRNTIFRDALFFGAMSTLVIVCLIIFMATRYQAYLSFAVFAFSFGAWLFRVFGYGFEFVWPNYPELNDITYALLIYAVMISSSWMIVSLLSRPQKPVKYQKILFWLTIILIILGIFSALFLDLKITLVIPLYWFFPAVLLSLFIIYQEHKEGSIKARWFAISMTPLLLGALIVVLFALELQIPVDPVMVLMLGIVSTCLLLTVMISTYLIKLLQNQRDSKEQQSLELEKLVKERTQELEMSNFKLHELAANDPLTKLPNRRSLDRFVDQSMDNEYASLGIAMVDLDHFKRINDNFGHDVGDIVLCQLADLLRPLNTPECLVARYGGEEFAIIQRQPNQDKFVGLLKELHNKINKIVVDGCDSIQVKACIGWAICANDENISECFRRADKALYQAKEQGRNLVVSGEILDANP